MRFFLDGDNPVSAMAELRAGLSRLSLSDNFQGFSWEGAIAAGAEAEIENKLRDINGNKIVPSHYIIITQDGQGIIVKGSTTWTTNFVYIRNRALVSSATVNVCFLK